MSEILAHKQNNVTTGVLDKSIVTHENLQSVTFLDKNDVAHTVFAHVNGPFHSPAEIVKAWEDGILHVYESHQDAIDHWATQEGAGEFVQLLHDAEGGSSGGSSQSGGGS